MRLCVRVVVNEPCANHVLNRRGVHVELASASSSFAPELPVYFAVSALSMRGAKRRGWHPVCSSPVHNSNRSYSTSTSQRISSVDYSSSSEPTRSLPGRHRLSPTPADHQNPAGLSQLPEKTNVERALRSRGCISRLRKSSDSVEGSSRYPIAIAVIGSKPSGIP